MPRPRARLILSLRRTRGEGRVRHDISTWVTKQCQHIGNTWLQSKACRNAGGELLSSSSQAPKSNRYGGCDELDNSLQRWPGCVVLSLLFEKLLPMSCHPVVTHVLIPSLRGAPSILDIRRSALIATNLLQVHTGSFWSRRFSTRC